MSSPTSKKAATVLYTKEQKKEIIDFVHAYNAANKKGGSAKAIQKYRVSSTTLNGWLKNELATAKKTKKPSNKAKGSSTAKQAAKEIAVIPAEIIKAETEDVITEDNSPTEEVTPSSVNGKGRRYTSSEKHEVLDFIEEYNQANGRGGQSRAADKFGVSVMTISGWRKSLAGSFRTRKLSSSINSALSANLVGKVNSLIELGTQIRAAETELAKLKSKFDSLSSSIKSAL